MQPGRLGVHVEGLGGGVHAVGSGGPCGGGRGNRGMGVATEECCPRPGSRRERGPGLSGQLSVVEAEGEVTGWGRQPRTALLGGAGGQ